MAKIRCQKWQLCPEISVLVAPQQKAEDRERMTKIMEPNTIVASALNARSVQCLVERITKGSDRIASPAWANKKRLLGRAGAEVLYGNRTTVNKMLDHVWGQWDHSRFVEFGMTDMEGASVEINVCMCEPQQLPCPQSSEIQNAQCGAKNSGAYRRSPSCW
jgi:hypothetical protein